MNTISCTHTHTHVQVPTPAAAAAAAPHHELEGLFLQHGLGRVHSPAPRPRPGPGPPLLSVPGRSQRRQEPALPRVPPTSTSTSPRCPDGACAVRRPTGNGVPGRATGKGPVAAQNYKAQKALRRGARREPVGACVVCERGGRREL